MQARVAHDFTPKHNVTVSLIDGLSGLDRDDPAGPNTVIVSEFHFSLANLAHRFTPSDRFFLTHRFAYLRERFDNRNRDRLTLSEDFYT